MKSPGDGRTYVVGTIEIQGVLGANDRMFSNDVDAQGAVQLVAKQTNFSLPVGQTRQVVIVQCTDAAGDIQWQNYFYGFTPGVTPDRATNARGISVFPVWAFENGQRVIKPLETRVAICGEFYDQILPGPAVGGRNPSSAQHPSGFIAVYDGNGNHRWNQRFFGDGPGDCAITDVSIRITQLSLTAGQGLSDVDLVTYCGISTFDATVTTGNGLDTLLPFDPPTASGCPNVAGGGTVNGANQWDGFVGRISRDHASGLNHIQSFHSIVGGNEQDGLWGICEIDRDRFVCVGSTARKPGTGTDGTGAGNTTNTFPFTAPPTPCLPYDSYCVGVAMVFNADPALGNLLLERSVPIGHFGASIHTVARDVLVQPKPDTLGVFDSIYVVGSTDDGSLFGAPLNIPAAPQAVLGPPTDGFVLRALAFPVGFAFSDGSYVGFADSNDGLTGIGAWNEYSDHVSAIGITKSTAVASDSDILVASFFLYTCGPYTVPTGPVVLHEVPTGAIGGSPVGDPGVDDVPTALGMVHATVPASGFRFLEFDLGSPAGGGIAVDPRARLNVVGQTAGAGYPVSPANPPDMLAGRNRMGGPDAVRTALDMLPVRVHRSDGSGTIIKFDSITGLPFLGFANAPSPSSGLTGATTPTLSLAPFGRQAGVPTPALPCLAELSRMMIDYEGPAPAQSGTASAAILIDRPPNILGGTVGLLQVGFPAGNLLTQYGVEDWVAYTTNTAVVAAFVLPAGNHSSVRIPLFAMSPPSGQFTVQVVCLLPAVLQCVPLSPLALAASPALRFEY